MGKKIVLLIALFLLSAPTFVVGAAFAQEEFATDSETAKSSSGLPIPRYVSLADEKVIMRTGPGLRYPIKWIYQRQKLPVEVIQEFDTWRKVRDIDGDDGWVHQSLLTGIRTVMVKGENPVSLYREADDGSAVLARFEPGVVARATSCAGTWCEVTSGGYSGFAQRKFLWGIYDSEDFD
jgi:SH3-like domain-containing protein